VCSRLSMSIASNGSSTTALGVEPRADRRIPARDRDLIVGDRRADALASTTEGSFYDFALRGTEAYIALSSPGYPSGIDRVVRIDLRSGAQTTLFAGLQRVIDVDVDSAGRLVVPDQCRTLSPCAGSPVVYRTNDSGTLDIISQNGFMFVPGRLVLVRSRPGRAQ